MISILTTRFTGVEQS